MDPYRTNKLNQSILEVLSDLLQVAVKDPRVGFVTLNSVKLNRDHSVAEVFWSVMGDEEERQTSFAGLKKARGFLQSKLVRTLGLRQAPELRFVYDDSVERGIELDDVLDELAEQGEFLTEDEKTAATDPGRSVAAAGLMRGLRAAPIASGWCPTSIPIPTPSAAPWPWARPWRPWAARCGSWAIPIPPVGPDRPAGLRPGRSQRPRPRNSSPTSSPTPWCWWTATASTARGPLEEVLDRFENRLCIDHHLVSGRKAPEAGWVEARACSTCTLVHQVIEVLGRGRRDDERPPFEMTLDMATNIYAGLINDTGGFRFNNTLPFTFELAGRLSALGVDTAEVARAHPAPVPARGPGPAAAGAGHLRLPRRRPGR